MKGIYVFHEVAVRKIVHGLFLKEPEWAKCLAQYQRKMESGFFPYWYIDSILQSLGRYWRFDIYDAFCFAVIHTAIKSGDILTAQVDIGVEPFADKRHMVNNRLLQEACEPFWGKFWGDTKDSDGLFGWRRPVTFGQVLLDGSIYEEVIEPMSIPFEVGYTDGSRSLLHLFTDGGLARWPYGSSRIHLFKTTGSGMNLYAEEKPSQLFFQNISHHV